MSDIITRAIVLKLGGVSDPVARILSAIAESWLARMSLAHNMEIGTVVGRRIMCTVDVIDNSDKRRKRWDEPVDARTMARAARRRMNLT